MVYVYSGQQLTIYVDSAVVNSVPISGRTISLLGLVNAVGVALAASSLKVERWLSCWPTRCRAAIITRLCQGELRNGLNLSECLHDDYTGSNQRPAAGASVVTFHQSSNQK